VVVWLRETGGSHRDRGAGNVFAIRSGRHSAHRSC
jgi:hypothetical protein